VADELPAVIVDMVRGGPGMGNISPSQSDYFQATRGGGHGDYRTIVLAPSSVQDLTEIVPLAFELADKYRNPVLILGDGMLGQMMEPVDFDLLQRPADVRKDYILTGAKDRPARYIYSLIFDPKLQEEHNWKLQRKFQLIEQNEVRYRDLSDRRRRDGHRGLRHGRAHREGRPSSVCATRGSKSGWCGPSVCGLSRRKSCRTFRRRCRTSSCSR